MGLTIKKAVKYGAKARVALYGPAGSGKTYTALSMAQALAGENGRIIVIDSERGSASKYADLFDFDTIEMTDFHPHTYISAINMALRAKEYGVLIIDSITHEWDGTRGALELAGQNFTNWAKVTPLHNAFVDAMLAADLHVIVTMRAKEEHVVEPSSKDKSKTIVRPVGIEPIQRKGIQYEFDVVGSLDLDNTLTIIKSRCSALHNAVFYKADKDIADTLATWLDGVPAPAPVVVEPEQPVPPALPPVAQMPAPAPAQAARPAPVKAPAKTRGITPDQRSAIVNMSKALKLAVPEEAYLNNLNEKAASKLIEDLSAQYNQRKQAS